MEPFHVSGCFSCSGELLWSSWNFWTFQSAQRRADNAWVFFLFLGWTNPLNPVKNTEGMNLGVLSGSSCPAGAQRDNLSNLVFVGLRGPKKFNRSASEWNKTERAGKCFAFFGSRNDSSDESVFECLCLKPFDSAAIWDSLIQPCIKCLTQSQPADWENKQTPLLPQCKSRHPGS